MPFTLRPCEPGDRAALAALADAVLPDNPQVYFGYLETPIVLRASEQHGAGSYCCVVTAAPGQPVIGYGCIWPTGSIANARIFLMVRPEWRRRGAGSRILDELMAHLQRLDAPRVQARVRGDQWAAVTFLEKRGFVPVQQMTGLRQTVAEMDEDAYGPALQAVRQRGIALTTLAEEQEHEPECWIRLHNLWNAAYPDSPEGQLGQSAPWTREQVMSVVADGADLPDAFFIAKMRDQYIGWTSLSGRGTEPGCLRVGEMTGVRPEYRRQGVAMALKMQANLYARQHGYQAIITRTANPAMLALNEKLGFRRGGGEVRLVKSLRNTV